MKTRSGITLVYAGDDAQERFEEFLVLVKAGKVDEANALVAELGSMQLASDRLFSGTDKDWNAHPMNGENSKGGSILDDLTDPEAFSACLMTPTPGAKLDFEAWATAQHLNTETFNGHYISKITQGFWECWQAARK